jgi:hypothetical protein
MKFTSSEYATSSGDLSPFELTENGRVRVGAEEDEMDLFAERLASAIITV